MKTIFQLLSLYLITVLLLERCANPTAITGGVKDTIPPVLTTANPPDQNLNTNTNTFTYTFDEPINADKLQQELIITPTTEVKFTSVIRKDQLTIKFEEPFSDTTTYTFNFRNSVGDATEKNPVENLKYAFSTGPFIDSLQISGILTSFLSNETQKNFLVGLYNITDTLITTEIKPYYFSNTLEDGRFTLENLRPGKYLLFSFLDENNNLLFNPENEHYGIYPDTITLLPTSVIDSIEIKTVDLDASLLRKISSRPNGKLYQIRYTKPVTIKQLSIDSSFINTIKPQLSQDQSEILVYKDSSLLLTENDSIRLFVTVSDTLQQTLADTLFIKFNESKRKSKEWSVSTKNLLYQNDTLRLQLNVSKPIHRLNPQNITLSIDTLIQHNPTYAITRDLQKYDGTYDFLLPLNLDSLYKEANKFLPDSSALQPMENLTLKFAPNSFFSIENDTLPKPLEIQAPTTKENNSGVINISVQTMSTSFEVRLLNRSKTVVRTSNDIKQISFKDLPPNSYSIIILIDTNNNGVWEIANPWSNTVSEPIYIYPGITELKPNWIIDINDISF
jgi:uncharacterized protein (DUF2141 family)